MKLEVAAASESTVMQKDDDPYPSDPIVEKVADQHAVLKNPKSMVEEEENIPGDASEEVYILPEMTAETIKACLPESGIKLTAPFISSGDDTQYTHDDIRHEIPSAEKGDTESTLPKEQQAGIAQSPLQECASIKMGDSNDDDLEVIDVKHEKNEINVEASQISSMLLKPDIVETAEYKSDEIEEENFSEQILPPIKEKSIEQPFYEESREVGDISAHLKAEDDSSMKTAEIQVENKHIPLTADQEGKSPQDLSYEKETDNERMSPEDAQQISEEISESRNESSADEEAEPTSEPKQSYHEVLEPSQIISKGANDSEENAKGKCTEKEVTTSTEQMPVDSSSTIEDCSKNIESEIYESKTIRSEDDVSVDQLGGCATIESTEKSGQVGLAAETEPENIQENDEHQICETEVEENETTSEMIKQNRSFPESSLEKHEISTESISYNHANMSNATLEEDNDNRNEIKAEETGCSFQEENNGTVANEPHSSDQISSITTSSIPLSETGNSPLSIDSDKISSLNDNRDMEFIDTEAKLEIMQEIENKREIVVEETARDDIPEETIDEPHTVSEVQVDSLTLERNTVTDETGLTVDSRQNIPLLEEDQLKKLTDVRETAYVSEEEKNSIEEENESMLSPDEDTEKVSESNNEETQHDTKPSQPCGNEPHIVKHSEIVKPEIEETKSDQGEQNQENSISYDAIGTEGDTQTTFTNLDPTSPENDEVKIDERMEKTVSEIEQKNIENVELRSVREVTSAENNLEDDTNSAVENNVTSEASINKGDDQNENESLSVTCVQTGTEAEDTINKTDDSEKEVDLQYTEETQSTRDATVESFPGAITDEIEDDKNLENSNSDPSQQHEEININNSNYNEESNAYKEQEPNESNQFYSEDESKTEEAKDQVYEDGSSSNKEGTRGTVEVSQSQDECSKVHEDSIHVIEVEETIDKQHEEQEDRSPYGAHDGVLADQLPMEFQSDEESQRTEKINHEQESQEIVIEDESISEVKAMDAGIDSQKQNELSTSNSDGVRVQGDQTERESCKYDESDESDTGKDQEIMSQEFEEDKHVNRITSQKSSPPIEQLEHTLGAAMDDPTTSKPSEFVNDEVLTVEASKEAELEAEQHIQTNEDPEQKNDISADKQIIQDNSSDKLQHITTSENSTTFAEADKHESADHLEVVDCTDDKPAENLQESESENAGSFTKEVDFVIQANSNRNFDQDLEHSNHSQRVETEGAKEDDQKVLQEAGSGVEEFQEMNADHMKPSENIGAESGNIEVQNDTDKTDLVTEPKIEGEISTGIPSQSGRLDQELNADNPVTSRDEGTEESSEVMQIVDINEEVSADCRVSPKEVIHLDPGTDLQQENENTASLDNEQVQEDQKGQEFFMNSELDEIHPEKDRELINQGFEHDSISSEMPCQETSATIEALRQDIGTAIEDHTQNEPSEIANAHVVEVSKEADFETEQDNQTNKDPEHENEISAEVSMDVENREFIPESAEPKEVHDTENGAINTTAVELNSSTAEDLSENENTNSEISQTVTKLDKDPIVNTEVMPQDMSVENRELVPESAEQAEKKNTGNEVINNRGEDLGSNTVEDSGSENTNLEISQKEINTEVVLQDMYVENHKLIPESTKLREENNAENEATNSRASDLGSNTVEDLSGNEKTHSEISLTVEKLDEDPRANTEVMPQDMSVENRELIPESVELTEENNTENEAINSKAEDLGSNTVEGSGNKNTNFEFSQTEKSSNENPVVNNKAVLQVMAVENNELIPELTELREENNNDNEAIKSKGEDLGSHTIEDLTGYENTNSEIPRKEINSDEDPTLNTEIAPRDIEVENHELIPESTELREENNTESEAINIRAEDDLSGNENTNSERSQMVTNLDEDPRLNTEVTPQDMSVENHGFVSESTELKEENNTENEAVNSIATAALGSNTDEDLSGNKNTNSEISQKEINLDEDPIVDTEAVLQDMSLENRALVPESAEITEDNNTENEAFNSRAEDLGSNTVEDSGKENTNLEISQKEISVEENPIVNTDIVLQDTDVESHKLIPESTELREEISIENEAIKCRAVDLGSNTVEDLGGNENTESEISQKLTNLDEEKNKEVMPQVMDVENFELIPEPAEIRKRNNTENEAINGRGEDLGSNTIEDLTANDNTNLAISQSEINSDDDPTVNTEIVPQAMDAENHELIPESTELKEENNTENEAINSRAADLDSNTVEDLSGNKNKNLEMSQKVTNLDEDPRVDTEVVPQDMSIENHGFISESTELREENEAVNSIAEDPGSNIAEDLSGDKNTNLEISQKEINLDKDSIGDTEVLLQDMSVQTHALVPESAELTEENNTENEAINSRAEDIGSNTVEDGGNENTNLEISPKEISLNENTIVNTDDVFQDMEIESTELIPESTEVGEENCTETDAIKCKAVDLGSNTVEDCSGNENTNSEISQKEINLSKDSIVNIENEVINSIAEDLGSNTVEDLGGKENTNLEISQKEINLDEDSIVSTGVIPKEMEMENHKFIQEAIELREENNSENEAINSKADDLGSNTKEYSNGEEKTNLKISQKEISLNEDPIVETEGGLQDMDVENRKFIPESTELIEENNTANEGIDSKAEDLGPNTAGDLGGQENTNSEISQKEINLVEVPLVEVEMLQTMEKIQVEEEPANSEKESTQEGSHQTLAEERTINQEKPIDTADAPQIKSEEKTCMYDEQIQGVTETHERSASLNFKEGESQGFEDDCTSKQDEQTPMHPEASGQNVGAEMPNQDNEQCKIDASEVNNTEMAENDEHRNEALVDEINEREVICTNAASSGNEMDTSRSEVKNDEILLLEEQTTESPPGISLTNNAEEGPELGVHEQSIEGNEDDELDSSKAKLNMEMVVNPIEEFQHKDDREGIPLDQHDPNHLASQDNEINGQTTQAQSGNGTLTAIEPNATKSCIDGHHIDEMNPHETVQTQGNQPVEPQKNFLEPSSPSEATSTTQNKEEYSVTLQDLNEEKEEDSPLEKVAQRELQVSSGFDLRGDLPYIPAVEEVSKTEEYLVPETQGAHDPQNNEMEPRSCTNSYSHKITTDADQFQHDSQQTVEVSCADEPSISPISENYGQTSVEVTDNQEETKNPEQSIEPNNEEQTPENIIDRSGCQAVKSGMTVEESKNEENYGGTSAYDSTEEKLVPAGSVEIARSSEPELYKESKKVEDEIMEEKEVTNADIESHEPKFHEIDNDADRDEKTTSSTECNTKSDECSITISKDSKEISEESNILVTSTSLEGEAVREIFQQSKTEEITENEVMPMEPKIDAAELLHQKNVSKPDNIDVEKEKQPESAKGPECCSTLEPRQGNDVKLFTEIQVPEDVSLRETDSGHSEAKLKLDEIPSEGNFTNASDEHMDCQEDEKISAAEIIASHICQEIETEEKLKQSSSEHQKQRPETSTLVADVNDKTFNEEVLHDESAENNFMSFDNPAEIVSAPEEREIENPSFKAEPNRDLNQKQELTSEFQGVESSAEVESSPQDSMVERLHVKEVCHLNEKRGTNEPSQLNFKSQPVSGENLVNSCETSTDNHTKTESFEPVIELQSEKLAISEEIGNDTQLQTVKNELMGESIPSKFEVYEAVPTDAAGEEEMHETVSSNDRALVQPPLPTTKSSDETEKPLITDEHSANTTFSVPQVSGINNTPPTEPNPTEEKVSEQQPMKEVSNQDSNTTQTMQIAKEEQLQGNYDDLNQSSRHQELYSKDSVNMTIDEPIDAVDVIHNQMNVEDFSKEGSESNTNEAPSLKAMQSVTTSKEEITADEHDETEVKPMLPTTIDEKKGGEDFIVPHKLHDDDKYAAEEPKTEKGKEDTENDHGEEDSELIPMISVTSRDVELKTQNKKSQHILSGMGTKMKNSISKVKKAMACASPQFSPDDVIIKLNKSKKS